MTGKKKNPLDRLFAPRGIAVFGGISRPGAFGHLITLSLIRYGYPGKLYPISSKGGQLNGHTIYKSLQEVDGPVDLDAIPFLNYLSTDPETDVIAAYLEGVADGQKFLETVRRVTQNKPMLIWKAGLTPPGNRATQSHTASLAGDAKIWEGVIRQGNYSRF